MKKYYIYLPLLLLLLLLLLCYPRSGQAEREIVRAIPQRWKGHERLILAIAKHETGQFNSGVFKACKNAFGLKTFTETKCKAPISEDSTRPLWYAEFKTPGDSVIAFISWLERRGINPSLTSDEVLEQMKAKGYFTDDNYIKKVKRYL